MPNYTSYAQSALDLQESVQSPEDTLGTLFSTDGFPGETYIGIALGSPRDNPLPPLPPEDMERYVPRKQKVSRWKSFSGLFGKKGLSRSVSASPCSYPQLPPYGETTATIAFDERRIEASSVACSHTSRAELLHGDLGSAQSLAPHRAAIVRNKSLRKKMSFRSSSQRKGIQSGRRVNRERSHTTPLPRHQDDSPNLQLNAESLLQVEIPSVEMERYSIMFSNLLQPPTTSSLLARREAHLENLYTGAAAKDIEHTVSILITPCLSYSFRVSNVETNLSKFAHNVVLN